MSEPASVMELGHALGRRLALEAIEALNSGQVHHGNLAVAGELLCEHRRAMVHTLERRGLGEQQIDAFNDACVKAFTETFGAYRRGLTAAPVAGRAQ